MEQCKKCRYFKYINKGLQPNYAGCEKCSVTIGNPYKCTAYKRVSLWKRIYAYINMFRLWLYVKTNRKIDLGVSHMLNKITEKLVWQNLDVE
jgi:hypothetical protein